MSGILGVFNLDGRPVVRALLADLAATLAHRGADAEGLWQEGPVGLACRLRRVTPEAATETQPLVGAAGTVVVFDGRLDDREALLAAFPPSPGAGTASPDPALVLAAYEAFGDAFPERLAGDFALALFDPHRRRLFLARDAIGVRPLYYTCLPGAFLFASEIKALLAHPGVAARPNADLLASHLLDRVDDLGGMTFFDGILGVPPAHVAVVTSEGLAIRRYWNFDPSPKIRLPSFAEYAEAFRDHLTRAVRRRLRSAYPVAVAVSGGLDSSAVFCLARTLSREELGRHPQVLGISYVSPEGSPSDEAAFLREIERDDGAEVVRVPVGAAGLVDGAETAVWHGEAPLLDELGSATHALLGTARRAGARTLLTGHWGDQVLFDQAYLVDLFRRLAWRKIGAHLREFGRWFTDTDAAAFRRRFLVDLVRYHVPARLHPLLRRLRPRRDPPWYAPGLRRLARRRAATARIGPVGAFHSAHARALYAEARSGHHVLCLEWQNKVAAMHGLEVSFPFLDRDLLAFLVGVPGEVQAWKGIPKALLREGLRGVLPEAIRRRTWKADFSHVVNDGMAWNLDRLRGYLEVDGMAITHGFVRDAASRRDLDRGMCAAGGVGCESAWTVSDVLGLELWLRVFFGEHPAADAVPTDLASRAAALGGTR